MSNKNFTKNKCIIVFLSICYLLLCSCGKENDIPKDGVGMFENASYLDIKYNNNEYEIKDEHIVHNLCEMCDRQWKFPKNEVKQEDCELTIIFVNARATLHIDIEKGEGLIDDVSVIIPDNILNFINDKILSDCH